MATNTNAKQCIPTVFVEIIKNGAKQTELRALSVIPFYPMKELIVDKRNLRRGAEQLLRWNVNK